MTKALSSYDSLQKDTTKHVDISFICENILYKLKSGRFNYAAMLNSLKLASLLLNFSLRD